MNARVRAYLVGLALPHHLIQLLQCVDDVAKVRLTCVIVLDVCRYLLYDTAHLYIGVHTRCACIGISSTIPPTLDGEGRVRV